MGIYGHSQELEDSPGGRRHGFKFLDKKRWKSIIV
jgi:hypothetical protein